MPNRREFLACLPASALPGAAAQPPFKIRRVDIVHHTHTDIGYTELPSVVRDLQKRYLDAALDACVADAAFRWTIESLVGLDDWWRSASAARRTLLQRLVREGRMDVMGLPFNQTPFLNALQWRQMMSWIPASLWQSLNIRAAMQNDVNGFPRAGAMHLLDRGVGHLLMGLNADSGGPPFARPSAFWWKQPDGRRLFVWHGEHYGSVMRYIEAGRKGDRMLVDEASVRAAHAGFVREVQRIEAGGYDFEQLILTFTDPLHYDNGAPFPTLAPFIAVWNRLGLQPSLRLTTATQAVLEMEKAAGARIPVLEGEWTDWWANGDASGPREVAASRVAKRHLAAALSPVFGPLPDRARPEVEEILRDLCLFDEHTWGASESISAPYSLNTLAQYVEKSALAYKPMGRAEILLARRVRATVDPLTPGPHVINPAPEVISGWASVAAAALPAQALSLVDVKTRQRTELQRQGNSFRFWVDPLPPNSIRLYQPDNDAASSRASAKPSITLDASGWPRAAVWPGMRKPLFDGAAGDFLCVGVIPPADRRTITSLHAKPDPARREASFRQSAAAASSATSRETPHTVLFSQALQHERLAKAQRTLELWKQEPRARFTVQFDRLSSTSPEVLFLSFALPAGLSLPVLSSGGVPFTPYRDQLRGSCKDYFGIDGWAHYASADGHWLWVTRDAPLVALGSPHVVERHQAEPTSPHRILAMVFDNCWHTNFVADSHGTMQFQFELAWRESLAKPADLAEALSADPIVRVNPSEHEPPALRDNLYRP